jgi:hypothetical protein
MSYLLAVNLLVIGIESVVHGASGRKNVVKSSSKVAFGK